MGKDFTVTIHDEERAAEWQAVLGTTTAHVKSPIPTRANLPGRPDVLIYELDLDLITPEQRQRLSAHITAKFNIPPSEVESEIDRQGVAILAEDCTVTITNPHRYT